MSGTYVLEIGVPTSLSLEVGALGTLEFDPGTYAYVGSATGPGGFARVDRHRELARSDRDVRHWHVDYLLGRPETSLERAYTFPGEERECALAAAIPGDPVPGFGASDCSCPGHLFAVDDGAVLEAVSPDPDTSPESG